MVSIECVVWCLFFVYGVSCESPTPSSDHWSVEPSVSEENSPSSIPPEWKKINLFGPVSDEIMSQLYVTDPTEWTAYSPEVYPIFRKAVRELAGSERGILIFWDTLNRPEFPREVFEQVFAAYNRLASEDISSSTTEGSQETTMYHLATTDPNGSEVATDVYTEDGVTSEDDSGAEYQHTTVSHKGDEAAMYYTTESPMLEAMLTDEDIYASAVSSENKEYITEDVKDVYEATVQEEVLGGDESVDPSESTDVPESEWENIVRRSGVLVEEHSSSEDAHCEDCPLQAGSIRGIPGVHFPNYDDIPITSFSCADKRVPGFYADLETGCQIFHVCWPHRRESFLCPIGTLFNQAILACDYWYSTNCSLSSLFFDVTTLSPKSTSPVYEEPTPSKSPKTTEASRFQTSEATTDWYPTESYIVEEPTEVPDEHPHVDLDWFRVAKFLPVKSKVTIYSKHSSKKPGSKWVVKQKHDVIPLVEEFLELTKNVAKNAIRLIPQTKVHVVKPGILKPKLVKVKPAAKLEPCLKIKDHKVQHQTPLPPVVVKKPQPLPKLDSRFIVKPVVVKKHPVVYVKKDKLVFPKVAMKQVKPVGIKTSKHHVPEIVMKALEMAGNVLQRDILDLTRQALVESHVGSVKSKH